MAPIQTRRGFLGGIAAAGAAGLIRAPREEAAEGTLETTSVRFIKNSGICRTRRQSVFDQRRLVQLKEACDG